MEQINMVMVTRVYVNEENGYTVGRYKDVGKPKAKGQLAEVFTVVGYSLPDNHNVIVAEGEWEVSKYGKQFVVSSFEEKLPTTEAQFVAFVSSNVAHLGKKKAKKLYAKYGESVWEEAELNPNILTDAGIKDKRIKPTALQELLVSTRGAAMVSRLLQGEIALSSKELRDLAKTYGASVVDEIKKDPYILTSYGASFDDVDRFTIKNGFLEPESPKRIRAAAWRTFTDVEQNGHAFALPDALIYGNKKRGIRLGIKPLLDVHAEVSVEMIQKVLNEMTETKAIYYNACGYYTYDSLRQECLIAKHLRRIFKANRVREDDGKIERLIQEFESQEGINLSQSQIEAAKRAFTNNVTVITGCPGTGKTTLVNCIVFISDRLGYNPPVLVAPTGKASRRLAEATGIEASTILSCVGWNGVNDDEILSGTNPCISDADLIVVDEVSMVDQKSMAMLLSSIEGSPRIVLIGDPNQLPSVGAGNVLGDIIYSKTVPVTELKVIFRQQGGGTNPIVVNAQKMLKGDLNLETTHRGDKNTFEIWEYESDEKSFNVACKLYQNAVKRLGIENVSLMCPYRRKIDKSKGTYTPLTTDEFNSYLQEQINPKTAGKQQISSGGRTFRVGDRVMQQKNTPDAKNGDTGIITAILPARSDPETGEMKDETVRILFNGVMPVEYTKKQMLDVNLAYASTVHKMQGAEAEMVILCLSGFHGALLARNLVYTAITRAKKRVIIIGQRKALNYAILNDTSKDLDRQRMTLLCPRLRYYFKK